MRDDLAVVAIHKECGTRNTLQGCEVSILASWTAPTAPVCVAVNFVPSLCTSLGLPELPLRSHQRQRCANSDDACAAAAAAAAQVSISSLHTAPSQLLASSPLWLLVEQPVVSFPHLLTSLQGAYMQGPCRTGCRLVELDLTYL